MHSIPIDLIKQASQQTANSWVSRINFIRKKPNYGLTYQHEMSRIIADVTTDVSSCIFEIFTDSLESYKEFYSENSKAPKQDGQAP